MRVVLTETPASTGEDLPSPDQIGTRTQTLEDMRDALNRRCEAVGDPSAAALFDSALAARPRRATSAVSWLTGGEVGRTYPWRYTIVALYAISMIALLCAIPLWLVLTAVTQYLRNRIPAGVCATCGYNRTGLRDDAACPECGALSSHNKK